MENFIRICEHEGELMVSSNEVAEKFSRRHQSILESFDNMELPENFRLTNFREHSTPDSQG